MTATPLILMCSIDNCGRHVFCITLCETHYRRQLHGQDVNTPIRVKMKVQPTTDSYKVCTCCKQNLPLTTYGRHAPGRESLSAQCKECRLQANRVQRSRAKIEMLTHYGNACVCCGEGQSEFLVLDHINNDGAQERRSLHSGRGGAAFYARLRRLGWPPGYQLLCYNCNCAKAYSPLKQCPHKIGAA